MPSVSTTLSLAAAVLVLPAFAAWNPNKPYVFSDDQMKQLGDDLIYHSPPHNDHSTVWAAGWMPQYCYNEARTYNLNPADFEVKNVYYTDCSAAWAVCRHKTASIDWPVVIDTLGRVPVGMRQYISNLLILPDDVAKAQNKCAYTYEDWRSSSYAPGCYVLAVLAHESTHILDAAALQDVSGGTQYSSTDHWQGAYDRDASVATGYARSSWSEDFADTGRAALSEMAHPGVLQSTNSRVSDIANQLGNYQARLHSIIRPSTGRCTGKVDTSKAVRMSDGSSARIRGSASPPSTLVGSGVPEILKPENPTDLVWIYRGYEARTFI